MLACWALADRPTASLFILNELLHVRDSWYKKLYFIPREKRMEHSFRGPPPPRTGGRHDLLSGLLVSKIGTNLALFGLHPKKEFKCLKLGKNMVQFLNFHQTASWSLYSPIILATDSLGWQMLYNCQKVSSTCFSLVYCHCREGTPFKATTGGKMMCLGPRVVTLIISLPGHFSSWNLIIKLKVM